MSNKFLSEVDLDAENIANKLGSLLGMIPLDVLRDDFNKAYFMTFGSQHVVMCSCKIPIHEIAEMSPENIIEYWVDVLIDQLADDSEE